MPKKKVKRRTDEVSVNVRVTGDIEGEKCILTLAGISGVSQVIHLFPSETEPGLANLYVVKIREKDRQQTLRKIRRRRVVEYAAIASPRHMP